MGTVVARDIYTYTHKIYLKTTTAKMSPGNSDESIFGMSVRESFQKEMNSLGQTFDKSKVLKLTVGLLVLVGAVIFISIVLLLQRVWGRRQRAGRMRARKPAREPNRKARSTHSESGLDGFDDWENRRRGYSDPIMRARTHERTRQFVMNIEDASPVSNLSFSKDSGINA